MLTFTASSCFEIVAQTLVKHDRVRMKGLSGHGDPLTMRMDIASDSFTTVAHNVSPTFNEHSQHCNSKNKPYNQKQQDRIS